MAVRDVKRMTIEILKGYEFGDPRSFIPVNYDNLRSWKQLEKEVVEIHAKGGVVDLPGYECQYTEYDSETGKWTTTPPPGSPAAIEAERQTSHEKEQLDSGYYPELPSRTRPKWGSPDVGRFGYPIGR
jgi:hypothetical protein